MSDAAASETRPVSERFAPALGALAGMLSSRLAGGGFRLAIDIILIAILAFFGARLFWIVVGAPPVPPVEAAAPDAPRAGAPARDPRAGAPVLTEFDPFHRARGAPVAALSAAEAEAAPETGLDLVLFGVRATDDPGRATATIAAPDGRQQVYAVGDEIIDGVTLARVYPDRVILRRDGAPESLQFPSTGAGLAPAPAERNAQTAAAPPRRTNPGGETVVLTPGQAIALQAAADFRLLREGDRIVGIEIIARGDVAPIAAAGFAPGDVIVAVDGQPLRDAGALANVLRPASEGARVTFRRNGAERTITLRIAG